MRSSLGVEVARPGLDADAFGIERITVRRRLGLDRRIGGIGGLTQRLDCLASLFVFVRLGLLLALLVLPTTLTVLAPQVFRAVLPLLVRASLTVFAPFFLNLTVFFLKRLLLPPLLTESLTLDFADDLTLTVELLRREQRGLVLGLDRERDLCLLRFFFASALLAAIEAVKAKAMSRANAMTAMRRTFKSPEWWFILLYSSLWFGSTAPVGRDGKFMCDSTHRY